MTLNPAAANRGAAPDLPVARPGLLRALAIVAPLVTLLVLVQAVFAGRGLFLDADNIDIHGVIGNVTFVLVAIQAALVLFAGLRGRQRSALLGTNALLLVLVVAQIGLGYSGRDGGQAAAWHIPNGVLIFGLTIANMSLLARLRSRGE